MKSIIKIATVTTISLSMLLSVVSINAQPIKTTAKYSTQQTVNLNGKKVNLPSVFKHRQEQFRGVWISTVFNLDLPSKKNMTQAEYKADYIKMLDNLENLNMNAVIFQVRPKADAFYKSDINPWSEYLTGTQGKSPSWDPMEWMISETHKRGMEFHAWFNPYRVTTGNESIDSLASNNWARKNPNMVMDYGNKLYLNPGEPAVIKHITDTVMEVVERYDVDAIHFDDYFYPSKGGASAESFYTEGEKSTFSKYGKGSVANWRRENVNTLIKDINSSIDKYNNINKKDVQFGISPFGIWGHIKNHPAGSIEGKGSNTPSSSTASYDNQFADTRKWVKQGWIDYISPQIYWSFDTAAAPYGNIADWWAETVKGTDVDLYIGHGSYKKADINGTDKNWKNSDEILNQLKFNSLYEEIDGSIFFRYKSMLQSSSNAPANNEFLTKLKSDYFNKKVKTKGQKGHVPTIEVPVAPDMTDKDQDTSINHLKPILVKPVTIKK